MKKFIFSISICFFTLVLNAQFLCEPSDTRLVLTGVLKWQDPNVPSFSDDNRKDQELYDLLASTGIPDSARTILLDNQGTLEKMTNTIRRQMKACTENSTFVFYYAGHGSKIGNNYYFCNYDMGNQESSMFNVETLYDLAAKHFKGKRIIFMADCCYSGSLLAVGKKIADLGKEVIVLTSATSSNISTGNWTFTQTLLDDLRGDVFADTDGNGFVSLSETAAEIKQAMKYREYQLNGFASYGMEAEKVLIGKCDGFNTKVPLGLNNINQKQYVYAYSDGKWRTARVMKIASTMFTCQFYNYSVKEDVDLPTGKVREVYFPIYAKDQKVEVVWEGKYYPAKIIAVDDAFMYIHYEGYDASYDEWVMYDRIKTGKEIEKSIQWQGNWYPGLILEKKDTMNFVTYIGDAHTWDEWVGNSRVK